MYVCVQGVTAFGYREHLLPFLYPSDNIYAPPDDIWGDAVNLASRMESAGLPGKIHCTKSIVDMVQSDFEFESRGEVEIKSVGKMETFILTKRKRALPATRVHTRKPQRRRSSLLSESLQTLKSSRQLLEEKIEDLQDRLHTKEKQKKGRRISDTSSNSN